MSEPQIRGPKPGTTAGRKRKASSELSSNKHTERGRQRVENMSIESREIERAKNSDRQALLRATSALKEKAEYLNGDASEKEAMLEAEKERVLKRRYDQKRSAAYLMQQKGHTEATTQSTDDHTGAIKQLTDGHTRATKRLTDNHTGATGRLIDDSEWEDITEDEHDPELELRWREDELFSLKSEIPTAEQSREAGEKMKIRTSKNLDWIVFRHWRKFWKREMRSFERKLRKVDFGGYMEDWVKWYFSLSSNRITEYPLPEDYFSTAERAIFRAVAALESDSWYNLPGPAEWWPDSYDYGKHGWDITSDPPTIRRHEKALELVLSDDIPEGAVDRIQFDFSNLLVE